jgi:hypothetical protein
MNIEQALLCLIAAAAIEQGTGDPVDVFEVSAAIGGEAGRRLLNAWDIWTSSRFWPMVQA